METRNFSLYFLIPWVIAHTCKIQRWALPHFAGPSIPNSGSPVTLPNVPIQSSLVPLSPIFSTSPIPTFPPFSYEWLIYTQSWRDLCITPHHNKWYRCDTSSMIPLPISFYLLPWLLLSPLSFLVPPSLYYSYAPMMSTLIVINQSIIRIRTTSKRNTINH